MKIADILLIGIVILGISACSQSNEKSPATEHPNEIVSEIDGTTMVLIPAGTFEMGSTTGDSDEQPVHTVTLDAFYMDVYEVTNAHTKNSSKAQATRSRRCRTTRASTHLMRLSSA